MDYFVGQQRSTKSPAALAARVTIDAKRAFGNWADDREIDRYVRQAMDELTVQPLRVSTFVPVLALRRVRELLEAHPVAMMEATADV